MKHSGLQNMEVSNDIKEEIRRTQSDLKNAIRVHQLWITRLQEDENNDLIKRKVKEAEKDIISVSQIQKRVVERLRRELELYQRQLKIGNKQVNSESDNRFVAQQLRDHLILHRRKHNSLLKPSVLTELRRTENGESKQTSDDASDSESKLSIEVFIPSDSKENGTESEDVSIDKYSEITVNDSRTHFTTVLNKVKQSFGQEDKFELTVESWRADSPSEDRSDSDAGAPEISPSPSPPPIPHSPGTISQEIFLRFLELVTPRQKEALEKKRSERRKRCPTSTGGDQFLYHNFDMQPKRKKYNQFPYLQTCTPPQTRSQRLRKQQHGNTADKHSEYNGSNGNGSNAPAWLNSIRSHPDPDRSQDEDQNCAGCGRNDVPSLLVWCGACGVRLHTGCGADGRCPSCRCVLPDPSHNTPVDNKLYRVDKVVERARLQQRNMELCAELRKLETRAAGLKESLALHNEEKRELLTRQIQTQRNLHKLLQVMSKFKDTTVSTAGSVSNCDSRSDSSSKSNDNDD